MNLQDLLKSPNVNNEFKALVDPEFYDKKSSGVSYALMIRFLTIITVSKYVTLDMFPKQFAKIKGEGMVDKLVKLGLLSKRNDIYTATVLTKNFLISLGLNKFFIPDNSGVGDKDCLMNGQQFVKAFNMPNFYGLYFKQFGFLNPDGLLIRKKDDKYKLDFLEIEKDKGLHKDYLLEKRSKYIRLSRIDDFFKVWKNVAPLLSLRAPLREEFKFGVIFITTKKFDFGKGFKFINNISELV